LPYFIERRVAIVLVTVNEAHTLADSAVCNFEEKGVDKPAFCMFSASAGIEVVG
jgi:hypothetical protein